MKKTLGSFPAEAQILLPQPQGAEIFVILSYFFPMRIARFLIFATFLTPSPVHAILLDNFFSLLQYFLVQEPRSFAYPRRTCIYATRVYWTEKLCRLNHPRTPFLSNRLVKWSQWSCFIQLVTCANVGGSRPAVVPVGPHTPPPAHSNRRSARSTLMLLRPRSPRLHRAHLEASVC